MIYTAVSVHAHSSCLCTYRLWPLIIVFSPPQCFGVCVYLVACACVCVCMCVYVCVLRTVCHALCTPCMSVHVDCGLKDSSVAAPIVLHRARLPVSVLMYAGCGVVTHIHVRVHLGVCYAHPRACAPSVCVCVCVTHGMSRSCAHVAAHVHVRPCAHIQCV